MAAAAALAAGCTMCPDPYDYSGPVPNGSAPQNDFRARSHGIHPLGAATRPWPPVVKHGRGNAGQVTQVAAGEPTPADPVGDDAQAEAAPVEPISVLVDAEEAAAVEEAAEPATVDAAPEARPLEQADSPPETPAVRQVHDVQQPQVEMPPLAETPGWRPRRTP